MSVYINPYTDFGFKKLFGEEASKDLLIDFLNSILPKHHQIAELNFQNVENLPDTNVERKAFFDIHCRASSGERFIVEMQKAEVKFFKDRSIYYITFPIRDQAQRGEWNFELKAIYFIAILDFFYEEDKNNAKFFRQIDLKDQNNEVFYDKLQMYYLQMPAFNKKSHELGNRFEKWAYFLKNLETLDKIPQILNEPIFERAFGTAMLANLNPEQAQEYEHSRLNYIGIREVIRTAEDKGIAKGIAEGEARGRAEGREEGRAEGEAKGRAEGEAKAKAEAEQKAQKTIIALHNNGVPIPIIVLSVDKTEAEVRAIIAESK